MATLEHVFEELSSELENLYPKQEAVNITRLVFQETLGLDRIALVMQKGNELEAAVQQQVNVITEKLLKGQPVQQLLGKVRFLDCHLRINKNVLIPRPETEELAQEIIREHFDKERFVLDIGTGSGCIAIALAKHLPESSVTAIDISQPALEIARINSIANNAHIDFQIIDVLKDENWKRLSEYDIIVSNPPYIPQSEKDEMHENVVKHEPHIALFVPDEDPLIFYRKIAELALKKLSKNGVLYFETHANYGKAVKKMLENKGFSSVKLKKDINGKPRFIRAMM